MYKVNYRHKDIIVVCCFMLILGIGFLVGGLIYFDSSSNKKDSLDSTIDATYIEDHYENNSDGGYDYKPIYHYTVNGKEYTCKSKYNISKQNLKEGKVYYEAADPSNCLTDETYDRYSLNYIILAITSGGGVLIIVAFLIMMFKEIKKNKKIKHLIYNGRLVKGLPHALKNNVDSDSPYSVTIIVDYTFPDGTTRRLESEPQRFKKVKQGSIDLLYDPHDYDNYFLGIDIEYIGNQENKQ